MAASNYQLARLAEIAYGDGLDVALGVIELGGRLMAEPIQPDGRAQAIIVKLAGDVVLAIRGTDGLGDWLRNLRRWPTALTGATGDSVPLDVGDSERSNDARERSDPQADEYAHRGFIAELRALWPGLQTAGLADVPAGKLVITGHSQGGAVGALVARYLGARRLVTFGCPRPGNRALARAIGRAVANPPRQYVRPWDMVPRIPFLGDWSPPRPRVPVLLTEEGPEAARRGSVLKAMLGSLTWRLVSRVVEHHSMSGYRLRLR